MREGTHLRAGGREEAEEAAAGRGGGDGGSEGLGELGVGGHGHEGHGRVADVTANALAAHDEFWRRLAQRVERVRTHAHAVHALAAGGGGACGGLGETSDEESPCGACHARAGRGRTAVANTDGA